jgi:hypothetical protein
MNVVFNFDLTDEPPGKIRLARLIAFAEEFQRAALRSAQAELNIPAFRRGLGDEPRPEYRLSRLTEGSVGLTLESIQDREIDGLAVARHLDALQSFKQEGTWPSGFQRGELRAWSQVYQAAFRGSAASSVEVIVNGTTQQIDGLVVTALANATAMTSFRHIECVGELHMIEVLPAKHPRFRIDAEQVDLIFELTPDLQAAVDSLRWQRVKAEGLWETGTNRAQLTGALEPSAEPAGVTVLSGEEASGAWIQGQLERLRGFADMSFGWDGPHSLPTTPHFIEVGTELLTRIEAQFSQLVERVGGPVAFPAADGTVAFEWQVESRFLAWELTSVGYRLYAAEGDETLFEADAGQQQVFQWITWLLHGEPRPT